mmetsp:Transcript_34148/g.109586  ORF Transcript_34148/g.109586 Transcript_34148/m.109586 type:complete len:234 (-) Transcript_34148:1442-2143(-)
MQRRRRDGVRPLHPARLHLHERLSLSGGGGRRRPQGKSAFVGSLGAFVVGSEEAPGLLGSQVEERQEGIVVVVVLKGALEVGEGRWRRQRRGGSGGEVARVDGDRDARRGDSVAPGNSRRLLLRPLRRRHQEAVHRGAVDENLLPFKGEVPHRQTALVDDARRRLRHRRSPRLFDALEHQLPGLSTSGQHPPSLLPRGKRAPHRRRLLRQLTQDLLDGRGGGVAHCDRVDFIG